MKFLFVLAVSIVVFSPMAQALTCQSSASDPDGSTGANVETGNWSFDSDVSTRLIRLQPGPQNAKLQSFSGYIGNLLFSADSNSFSIYQTTVDRLVCENNSGIVQSTNLPRSIEEINMSPVLRIDQLENRLMRCEWMQSLFNDFYVSSNTEEGWIPRCGRANSCSDGIGDERTIQLQSVQLDDRYYQYPDRYILGGSTTYATSGSRLSSWNPGVGEVFTMGLGGIDYIRFRSWGDNILMTEALTYFAAQAGRASVNFYLCR